MQKVYISLFIVLLFSCCSKGYDRVKLIAGDSCQYWYRAHFDPYGKTKYFFYFSREGKWEGLEERYADKKCYLYDGGDVVVTSTWSLVNDSVIRMGDLNWKLKIVNDTFLIVTFDKFHWVDTLYKVTDPHLLKKLQEVPIP